MTKEEKLGEYDATRATRIDPVRLDDEFLRLPGDLAYWNEKFADAVERLLKARRALEVGEAEIRREIRRRGSPDGGRLTEGYLDDLVATDPRHRALREEEDAAEVAKTRASGVLKAIMAKQEMLVSVGADARAERKAHERGS